MMATSVCSHPDSAVLIPHTLISIIIITIRAAPSRSHSYAAYINDQAVTSRTQRQATDAHRHREARRDDKLSTHRHRQTDTVPSHPTDRGKHQTHTDTEASNHDRIQRGKQMTSIYLQTDTERQTLCCNRQRQATLMADRSTDRQKETASKYPADMTMDDW